MGGMGLLAVGVWLWSGAAAALDLAEAPNPQAGALDKLAQRNVVRGLGVRDHYVDVDATPGEAWSLQVEGLTGISVTPANGAGPARARVRFDQTPAASVAGRLVLLNGGATEAAALPINLDVWPTVDAQATRAQVKDRASWPREPDYATRWDLFGFLPDAQSHPGRNIRQVDAWELTACTPGTGRHADCTQDGQAGLASGMSADRAWGHTVGIPQVTLAVLDSGIRWRNRDVAEKVLLNAWELSGCAPPGAMPGAPASFDVNHDGVFNIRDYDDVELADFNGNGLRDGQDLIYATLNGHVCSDGFDDDGNGYVDDIAGWDFFWDDNDPGDDTDFGHGDFEMRLSGAQANNGTSGVGVCPGCTILPIRAGDSFIVDVNRYARAVTFAVDNGAAVIQQALGGLGNTRAMQQAVEYAYTSGVPVIAAASDLNSYHHNWPSNADHAFMVHAIVFDGVSQIGGSSSSWTDATSFLNFNNCTNFGPKLMLSAPGEGCSSEATAKTAGQAGLVISYFRQMAAANPGVAYWQQPLSTQEVYQLLIMGADDIDVPGAETDAQALALKKYPSNEGFEERFGYGRNNAWRSLNLVAAQAIPPEVEITSPRWFEPVRSDASPSVEVRGRLQNLRTTQDVCFKLRWAHGVNPTQQQLDAHTVADDCTAYGLQAARVYGNIPMEDLRNPDARTREEYSVTLELTAYLQGNPQVQGVARRSFFVIEEPLLRQDYPKALGVSGESSPRMADMDGDKADEVVLVTGDGRVHVWGSSGREASGFPVVLDQQREGCGGPVMGSAVAPALATGAVEDAPSHVIGTPAVVRLGSNEHPSVVVATVRGAIYVVAANGEVRPGFPVCMDPTPFVDIAAPHPTPNNRIRLENGFAASPAVWDLDGDGLKEIYISGGDGQLHAWLADGTVKPGFPVLLLHPDLPPDRITRDRLVSSPVLADLDGDGTLEIVVGSNDSDRENPANSWLFAVHADGNLHAGGGLFRGNTAGPTAFPPWPAAVFKLPVDELLPVIGRGHPTTAAVADVNGDGRDEVLTGGLGTYPSVFPESARPQGVDTMNFGRSDFGALSQSTELTVNTMLTQPTIADLNGDGRLDVMQGMVGAGIVGLAAQGGQRVQYTHVMGAWDIPTGTFHDGFPAPVEDFQILMNYPVADVDGDGHAEVVVATSGYFVHAFREDGSEPEGWPLFTGGFVLATPALGDHDGDGLLDMVVMTRDGWLFSYRLPGPATSIQWAGFKHDNAGTGNVRLGLEEDEDPPDCTCQGLNAAGPPAAGTWLTALGLLWVQNRARRRRR